MPHISSLYHLIQELNAQQSNLIKGYAISDLKKETRDYALVRLVFSENEGVIKASNLTDAHFSFDKFYEKSTTIEHGCTPIL